MTTTDIADAPRSLKLRRGIALPLYAVALMLSYLSEAIGKIAAAIAQDP